MKLDPDVFNTLVTAGTTILVGIGTAIVAYKGTMNGVKEQIKVQQTTAQNQINSDRQTTMLQIQKEQERLDKSIQRQTDFAKRAIKNFISHEMRRNFLNLNYKEPGEMKLEDALEQNVSPFSYHLPRSYDYDEYNQLKYDLIKLESSEVEEIIGIYDMFYLIEAQQNIIMFTQEQYDAFKKSYFIYTSKYL